MQQQEMVGVVAAEIKPGMQIDIERGWFFEGGLGYAINRLNPWILAREKRCRSKATETSSAPRWSYNNR